MNLGQCGPLRQHVGGVAHSGQELSILASDPDQVLPHAWLIWLLDMGSES